MRAMDLVLVMVGAAVGGGLRYATGEAIVARLGASFPWHTFAINVVGAFALGALMVATSSGGDRASMVRVLVGVGVLGGFTTFSTLSYETVALIARGELASGMGYLVGSALAGIAAATAGMGVGRLFV